MSDTLIKVEGVSKKFCRSLKKSLWYGVQDLGNEIRGRRHGGNGELRPDEFWAVDDVSFELKRGECLGLIGRNGAGKTTLLRMLNGLIKPDSGHIQMRGRIGAMIALGAGFNPILTGRENIYVNASVLGVNKKETEARLEEIIDFSEIGEFVDAPVQTYSSGMQVRLGFSIASTMKPDILLLDEVLAVGDRRFRQKCFDRVADLLHSSAVIFVSHQVDQLSIVCNLGLHLSKGRPVVFSDIQSALFSYDSDLSSASSSTMRRCVDPMSSVSIDISRRTISWGDGLGLKIKLKSSTRMACTIVQIFFRDSTDSIVAEWNSKNHESLRSGFAINVGENILSIDIESLRLCSGRYSLTINFYEESGMYILSSVNEVSVEVTNSFRSVSVYQL